MREHWANCITHRDAGVDAFVSGYFAATTRRVLLVAAAGFDPRSRHVALKLADVLGPRLTALFVREERPGADAALRQRAEDNERSLLGAVPGGEVIRLDIFAEDGAPVGGTRMARELTHRPIPDDVTDVIVDLSALSIGVGFPAARLLLERCEAKAGIAFHLMIASSPDLDDRIVGDPSDRPSPIRGFAPMAETGAGTIDLSSAQVWIPQLTRGRKATLQRIWRVLKPDEVYKVCPVLPFPALDPRRADDLIGEYEDLITEEWHVDPGDFLYASEWNPLDTYRRLSRLKLRFDRTMRGTFALRMILSPMGSKVMAAGALMAAIEHDMVMQYVETERYAFSGDASGDDGNDGGRTRLLHMILSGPLYAAFPSALTSPDSTSEEADAADGNAARATAP